MNIDIQGPELDQHGNHRWPVAIVDAAGEPVGRVYRCHSRLRARRLAGRLAAAHRLRVYDNSQTTLEAATP